MFRMCFQQLKFNRTTGNVTVDTKINTRREGKIWTANPNILVAAMVEEGEPPKKKRVLVKRKMEPIKRG